LRMKRMNVKKLTNENIQAFNPERIMYFEVAAGGAMGNAGGQILYYLNRVGDIVCFATSCFTDSDAYTNMLALIENNKDKFIHAYGGMGNECFIGKKYRIHIDDNRAVFTWKGHDLIPSCDGVFLSVAEALRNGKTKPILINQLMEDTIMEFNHIKWKNDFRLASERGEGFSALRAQIFQDTVKFVCAGRYCVDGAYFDINSDNIITEYFDKPDKLTETSICDTKFAVINADCLETAQLMRAAGLSPCVLNLANRQNPGGGVLGGAGAQEENIFRRTNLFVSLYQFAPYASEYGIKRSDKSYPLNRNTGGIYSSNITVFRGSEKNGYCLLKQPFDIAFVTVPAINRPELTQKDGVYYISDSLIEPTKEKIRTILRIAGKYRHDCLILGAFGCGAFRNPPNHMAELFHAVFTEQEFSNRFRTVVFSIFEDHNTGKEHNPNGNVLPFLKVFDA